MTQTSNFIPDHSFYTPSTTSSELFARTLSAAGVTKQNCDIRAKIAPSLLDFDERVERFEAQPITIPVPAVAKGYIPDVLVHY